MSPEKEPRHPFATRLTAERAQESLMFGLLRGMTFFVLFCAAFLFWDIISKGSSKVFEGNGLINWEFLTEHPQTLHVIGEGEDEIKLSSSNYYKLKDEKMLNKWGEFRQSDGHDSARRELAARFSQLQNEWSKDSLLVSDEKFLLRERENATNKFAFWKEMLVDPKNTAEDFEIKVEEVPGMVTQFMLKHFEKERGRFSLVEEKVTLFLATHYPLDLQPIGDILINGFRKGVGFLEDHAHFLAQFDHIDAFVMQIYPVNFDRSLANAGTVDQVVHSVEATQ
jgi:hypothetical protein